MKIYLARHGESYGNKEKLIFGMTDYPLTEQGILHAKELESKLNKIEFTHGYTSKLSRAYKTAEICLKDSKKVIKLESLNEQNFGILEGEKIDAVKGKNSPEIGTMFENLMHNPPAESESYWDMYDRVETCLKEIIQINADVLIVSHTGPLSIIMTLLLDTDIENASQFYFEFGQYTMVELLQNKAKLRCFNK